MRLRQRFLVDRDLLLRLIPKSRNLRVGFSEHCPCPVESLKVLTELPVEFRVEAS